METKRKHPLAICEKCPFADRAFAATTGPKDAKVAVVSRSPGYVEAQSGKSFSGMSGRVLNHLLEVHGQPRDEVLATNVVLCQSGSPSEEAGNSFALAAACCEPRLEADIAGASTVIACGVEAAQAVTGVSNIARNRGYVHDRVAVSPNGSGSEHLQRVIVTSNPAVAIRNDGTFPDLMRDFKLALDPLPIPSMPKVRMVDTLEEAETAVTQMLEQLCENPCLIASDLETRGSLDVSQKDVQLKAGGLRHTADIVCAGFSIRPERAVVFGEAVCSDEGFLKDRLSQLWDIEGCTYLWHNGKYDVKVLRTKGIDAKVDEDSMLLSWCLDERPGNPESGAGGHSLEWLLKDELGWSKYESPSVREFKKTGLLPTTSVRHELYSYNGLDTAGCLALFEILKQRAINDNVWDRPYKLMLIRLSEAFVNIELEGNLFDSDKACDILEDEVWPLLRKQKARMRFVTRNFRLNPNSPKQMEELYYEDWGLKHNLMRPKIERVGKRSTDAMVRETILNNEFTSYTLNSGMNRDAIKEFTQVYDDFKSLDKQRGTYFEGLVLRRFPNGRIYTDFKIHGTESGRVSSANPNLQNITRTKPGMPSIRSAFIPDPGCLFLSGDLSQAELRTIAVLSGDNNLQAVYRDTGRSLHKEVAAEFYGDNYTKEQYVRAKNINFGVAYWQSAFSFAQLYHMDIGEAQNYIDFWWDRFPQVWEWTKEMEQTVLTEGEIQSPFGHKRRFYIIPADEGARLHIVKEGINFKPQNIAANITLWALIRFTEHLKSHEMWHIAQPRITVHDSILVNVREKHVEEVADLLKIYMESAAWEAIGWDFPYTAEFSVGNDWGSLHDVQT
jgi:uracil-DNA glycosylase family 4